MTVRSLIYLFTFVLFLLLTPQSVLALDYNQSRLDYQTQYSNYRERLVEYRSARSEYITYKTLVSQTRAIYVTQQFLNARQSVMINYLNMLLARIETAKGPYLSTSQADTLKQQIGLQLDQLDKQIPQIQATSTIEDISRVSKLIEKNIPTINTLGLQTQALILDSRMQEYQVTTVNLLGFTTEQVRRIAKEGKKDTTDIDRWLLDAEQKYQLALQGFNQSQTLIPLINSDGKYDSYRTSLKKSRQYLKETNARLSEIVINLKIE